MRNFFKCSDFEAKCLSNGLLSHWVRAKQKQIVDHINAKSTVLTNPGATSEIPWNKPAPPRSSAVVLSLSLDDPNRRVFQDVGGFGRRPIMYRYSLRLSGGSWIIF